MALTILTQNETVLSFLWTWTTNEGSPRNIWSLPLPTLHQVTFIILLSEHVRNPNRLSGETGKIFGTLDNESVSMYTTVGFYQRSPFASLLTKMIFLFVVFKVSDRLFWESTIYLLHFLQENLPSFSLLLLLSLSSVPNRPNECGHHVFTRLIW